MEITNNFCDAGGLGYRTYDVSGRLGYDACQIILKSLQLFDMCIRYNKA